MSMPVAMLTAVPAGAAAVCESTQAPNHASSLQGFKVGCVIDVSATPTLNANHIDVHDGINANWHRGAARTVTVTTAAASATITFAVGTLATADIRRPISGTGIGGTAFIRSVAPAACVITTCTSAVLSVASTAAGAITATVEHTSSRVVTNASYTFGATTSVLTSATGTFAATDVNKSVSGGGFPAGSRISAFTNATTVTVTPRAAAAHAAADDTITFGAVQFSAASPSTATVYNETWTRSMSRNTSAPAGFASCAGSTLTITAPGGGTNINDIELKVRFLDAAGADVAGGPWKANTRPLATTLLLSATCPVGAWVTVVIGQPGANAPKDSSPMASLSAALNLQPSLNATSDDCTTNTYEGFQVIGAWNNPGSFISGGFGVPSTVPRAVAQIAFTTAVVSFHAYVVPKTVAEAPAHQAVPHYDFTFPALPTSLAVCVPGGGVTTLKTSITFGFWATTFTTAPFTPTGSGNPQSAPVRQIGPTIGLFGQKVSLYNLTTQLGADVAPAGCTIIARTITPALTNDCGLG